ncbi:MAG TPA: GNAT family N-acetyltransferase [Thermoleophilaceae bacterium]
MRQVLETPRLRLREFCAADLDELAPMVADEEQMRFYPHTRTREEESAWLDRHLAMYDECGYGFWLIEAAGDGRFAGYCGIRPLQLDGRAETEIGWHVHKRVWNEGIATEAAGAVRAHAAERFGLDRLVALIYADHAASIRVAENIGMTREGVTVLDGDAYEVYATVS